MRQLPAKINQKQTKIMKRFNFKFFNRLPQFFSPKGEIDFAFGKHRIFVPTHIKKHKHVFFRWEEASGHPCGRHKEGFLVIEEVQNGFFIECVVETEWLRVTWFIK
jgi:hypothetical protein